jgi:hypothetical protein
VQRDSKPKSLDTTQTNTHTGGHLKKCLVAVLATLLGINVQHAFGQEVTVNDILVYEGAESGRRGEIRLQRTADGKDIYLSLPTGNLHVDPKSFAATVRRPDSKDSFQVDIADGKIERVAGAAWTNKFDSTPRQGAQCQQPVVKNEVKITVGENQKFVVQDDGKERTVTATPAKQNGIWRFCIDGKTTAEMVYSDELKVLTSINSLVTDWSGGTVYSKFGMVLKEIVRKK